MTSSSSSSCSSHSTVASSSHLWNHDVFLSFRGEDTRKTFVDHLYSALDQQGIHTYKDNETLPRGESIGPSLLKAIEESRIAVIVFSKNYVDSSWCLDELAYIMTCKDVRGQIVFPIFYDVDPSEVRKQKHKFGEAFSKYESENNNKVESWRKALVDASNISGWEPKNIANGHESKCIKEIVEKISLRLHPKDSSANGDLIGIEARLPEVKSLLKIGSGGVFMIGMWGIGGGGKTTLAFSVYKDISCHFDGCSFVENVREESSKSGLKTLQNKILSDVLKTKKVDVRSVREGKCIIKERLSSRCVLIVLDDVDHLDHLEALAGSLAWFGEGSRIIITTRDEHLLNAHKVNEVYSINLLNDDEAIQLFCRHAFGEHRPAEDYKKLSLDVISYAHGLPLALKMLGCFLCDKDLDQWMSALARLKDTPDTGIVEKLKISYDGLKLEEKEIFEYIACFFRQKEKDDAMRILDACGFHPVIGIKVLIQKALVTISDGRFDMHNLVQEMGHYIVRVKHPNNPEKHSRIWRHEDVQRICTLDALTENDMTESLAYSWSDYPPRFVEALQNMKKLRFLYVHVSDQELLQGPQFLSKELMWIYWYSYPTVPILEAIEAPMLGGLILRSSRIYQLSEGFKLLPSLKVLDLSDSKNLIRTPDFDRLPHLERLTLDDCIKLTAIHPSIGYHKRLVFLSMRRCSHLKMFPCISHMKKLEIFLLDGCFSLEQLLSINQNDHGPLKSLKTLDASGCTSLEKLPDHLFNEECCIEELLLPETHGLRPRGFVFYHLSCLVFLRNLDLGWCKLIDGDIPYDLGELSNLQVLDLSGNAFTRLYSSLTKLPRLKFLNLSYCKKLVEIPELPSSIAIVSAEQCDSLQTVADIPGRCKWLWNVSLVGCSKMLENKQYDIVTQKVLRSMLQGNAVENHCFVLRFHGFRIPKGFVPSLVKGEIFTLRLPLSGYNDFSGFSICTAFKKDHYLDIRMGYIPFKSLRYTTRWASACNAFLFFFHKSCDPAVACGIGLVHKGKPVETTKDVTGCSEFWEEEVEDNRTRSIKDDPKSAIKIRFELFDLTLYMLNEPPSRGRVRNFF